MKIIRWIVIILVICAVKNNLFSGNYHIEKEKFDASTGTTEGATDAVNKSSGYDLLSVGKLLGNFLSNEGADPKTLEDSFNGSNSYVQTSFSSIKDKINDFKTNLQLYLKTNGQSGAEAIKSSWQYLVNLYRSIYDTLKKRNWNPQASLQSPEIVEKLSDRTVKHLA